jgi:hypothetical protein
MSDLDPIDAYLMEFGRQLPNRGRRSRRALEEVEAHLRDAADALVGQGRDPLRAAQQAVENFGSPSQVLQRFELEAPFESEVDTVIRYLLLPVTGLTVLFGTVFLIASHFDDAPLGAFAMKVVASAVMICCSAILFYQGWTTKRLANWQRGFALASALLSIAFGSAGAVFTAHLGFVTHDWEMYGFVGAGLLILQGALATIELLNAEPPRLTAS